MGFYEKYKTAVDSICTAEKVDVSVGCDMLRSSIKGHFGISYNTPGGPRVFDVYEGVPADFDYNAAIADVYALK